ncbi:undecaprenyl-diphosphatase [Paludibacterium yongneupense]|uniref:undecaprenyl-diphosphatase n=1 Tax=Paludibacterium yongneupense TaxID=400061 RepID=UPI00041026F6|nr:undecaprenyl-diphosphatase [Paludibacterium yongneupense]
METLNRSLFLLLNAPSNPNGIVLQLARLFAEDLIFLIPLAIVAGWLWGRRQTRTQLLAATTSVLLGLAINALVGLFWQHPRPFMAGIGHTLMPHRADSSFPSDHTTVMLAFAFTLLLHRHSRPVGLSFALAAFATAWARVYLGVHFPLDIVGSVCVAGFSAAIVTRYAARFVSASQSLATRVYRTLLAPLIRRGLIQP